MKTRMKENPGTNEVHARTDWRDAVAAYTKPRVLQVLALGFASGLPLLLTYSTLQAWLATVGVRRAAMSDHAACSNFSLAKGRVSMKVRIGVLP